LHLLLLLACASNIRELYEAEKAQVMATPPAVQGDWSPELRLRLSNKGLVELSSAVLQSGLLGWEEAIDIKNPLGVKVTVRPHATVKRLSLDVGKGCASCLGVEASLKGGASWSAGPLSGELPFSADLGARLKFETERLGTTWVVRGKLLDITRLNLSDGQITGLDMAVPLKGWIDDALEDMKPFELGTFGGDELPLRALRLDGSGGVLEIQALTNVPGGAPVQAGGPMSTDWEVAIGHQAAAAMMRRIAFEEGLLEHEIGIDPRSFSANGADFTLGLRIWRLSGAGWWRDYTVKGQMGLQGQELVLTGKDAIEGEKSRGAGLADPLALLFESVILKEVSKGVNQALPAQTATRVEGLVLAVKTTTVQGRGDALVLGGNLTASAR